LLRATTPAADCTYWFCRFHSARKLSTRPTHRPCSWKPLRSCTQCRDGVPWIWHSFGITNRHLLYCIDTHTNQRRVSNQPSHWKIDRERADIKMRSVLTWDDHYFFQPDSTLGNETGRPHYIRDSSPNKRSRLSWLVVPALRP